MTDSNPFSRQDAALVLGVAVSADMDEVKRRYRSLARATHPDAGGDPDEFATIQRAYERLLVADTPAPFVQLRRPSRTPTAPPDLSRYVHVDAINWKAQRDAHTVTTAEQLAAYLAQPGPDALTAFTARSRAPGAFSNRLAGSLSTEFTSKLAVSGTPHGAHATQITVTVDAQSRRARRAVRHLDTDPRWIKQRRSTGTRLRCVFIAQGDRFTAAVHAAAQTEEILTKLTWPLTQWHAAGPTTNGSTL